PRPGLIPPPGPGISGLDDVYDNFNPQQSSQWDSLGHAAYSPGVFYNGATEDDVLAGRRNTIDYWARRGIVARAVVLDVARALPARGRPRLPAAAGHRVHRRGPGAGPGCDRGFLLTRLRDPAAHRLPRLVLRT